MSGLVINEIFLKWALLVGSAVQLIGFLFMLYAAYFVLPEIEEQLSNCKLITDKAFWGLIVIRGKCTGIQWSGCCWRLLVFWKGKA
jgi:hypothetical protein